MITMTLAQVMEAQPALERLSSERLPVKVAYRVGKLLRLVRPEAEQFVNQRNDLVRQFGESKPNGDVEVTAENRDAFFAKVNELATVEVQFDIEPLEIAGLDGCQVTAADLVALDRFLVFTP